MPYKNDTKIKCRKCGWYWQKSKGGLNPYKCHKCGYNNKMNIKGLGEIARGYHKMPDGTTMKNSDHIKFNI